MADFNANREFPMPDNLVDALKEIISLRSRLWDANVKWSTAVEKRELDNRSSRGMINHLRDERDEALLLLSAIKLMVEPVANGIPDDAANICCEIHALFEDDIGDSSL